MIYNWLASSMCKYVKRFGLSRKHKVSPVFGTDAHTHEHESYVPRLGHPGDNKNTHIDNNIEDTSHEYHLW